MCCPEALAPDDINVNCVCPGGMATDMLREVAVAYGDLVSQAPDEVFKQLISSQLRRHIDPTELARTICPAQRRRDDHSRPGDQYRRRRHALRRAAPTAHLINPRHQSYGVQNRRLPASSCICAWFRFFLPQPSFKAEDVSYVLTPSRIGVNKFVGLGKTGIEKAAEAQGVKARIFEGTDPSTRCQNVQAAIDMKAPIVAVMGFEFGDIVADPAPENPETKFVIVDTCGPYARRRMSIARCSASRGRLSRRSGRPR